MEDFDEVVGDTVVALLGDANRVPFLFVGSGISRRYMGTEDWGGMLRWVCDTVGAPMDQFFMYQQRLQHGADGDQKNDRYPRLASMMEPDFLKALARPDFQDWVDRHRGDMESGVPAMKIFIAEHLAGFYPTRNLEELELLRKASRHVAGVITTNYDTLLESIFPKYDTFIRQDDLLFSPLTGIGEIYKIHGSVEDPESMVIDERDYEMLASRQQYLLSKILTIFGEYPIIFMGYSLSDQDIREVISAIALCAGERRAREMAKRFIFVEYSDECAVKSTNYDVGNGRVVEMTSISTHNFAPIYEAIGRTRMRYAPKLLNQITRQLFEASYRGGEADKVVFSDIDNLDELPQDMDVVIGVGVKKYGLPVSSDDIHIDALFHNKNLPVSLVVDMYIDKYISQGGVPMYYYLSRYDGPLSAATREQILQKRCVDAYLNTTQRNTRRRWRDAGRMDEWSIGALRRRFGDKAYKHLSLLMQSEMDVGELEEMLKSSAKALLEHEGSLDSDLRKGIKILDFLKYGADFA